MIANRRPDAPLRTLNHLVQRIGVRFRCKNQRRPSVEDGLPIYERHLPINADGRHGSLPEPLCVGVWQDLRRRSVEAGWVQAADAQLARVMAVGCRA